VNKVDIVRAWKDPLYRSTLSPEQLAGLPAHPAGLLEISDEQMRSASGALVTTFRTCTANSFGGSQACCP
jgi:mersacidin/lichenicidin family type 2 lantibiotic